LESGMHRLKLKHNSWPTMATKYQPLQIICKGFLNVY
jgi:hypothetical protein